MVLISCILSWASKFLPFFVLFRRWLFWLTLTQVTEYNNPSPFSHCANCVDAFCLVEIYFSFYINCQALMIVWRNGNAFNLWIGFMFLESNLVIVNEQINECLKNMHILWPSNEIPRNQTNSQILRNWLNPLYYTHMMEYEVAMNNHAI